jgi:hypothetical protein
LLNQKRLLTGILKASRFNGQGKIKEKDSPESKPVQIIGKIERISVVNGLHNYYFRNAA